MAGSGIVEACKYPATAATVRGTAPQSACLGGDQNALQAYTKCSLCALWRAFQSDSSHGDLLQPNVLPRREPSRPPSPEPVWSVLVRLWREDRPIHHDQQGRREGYR